MQTFIHAASLQTRQVSSRSQMRKLRTELKIFDILCQGGEGLCNLIRCSQESCHRFPAGKDAGMCRTFLPSSVCSLSPVHSPCSSPPAFPLRRRWTCWASARATAPHLLRVRSKRPSLDPTEALPAPQFNDSLSRCDHITHLRSS